jgi:hypothetical protein
VGVAERDGEGVGGVTGEGVGGESEKARNHERDLGLFRLAVSGDLKLHGGGGKGVHGHTCGSTGLDDHAAHVSQDDRGACVRRVEEVFDGQGIRSVTGDESSDPRVHEMKALGELGATGRDEDAGFEELVAPPVGVDGAESGADGAGIDTEDDQGAL